MGGVGRIFPRGKIFYYAWFQNGREHKRSSKSESRTVAERALSAKLKSIGAGYNPSEDKLTFEKMIERLKVHPDTRARKTNDIDQRVAHLVKLFGGMRATEITTFAIDKYIQERQDEGARPATINRELAVLKRAINVCEVSRKPTFHMLSESGNERRDFLNLSEFNAVMEKIEEPEFRLFWRFAYFSSWRQGQIADLEWRDVDSQAGTVTARAETTKSGHVHTIPLVNELANVIEEARAMRRLDLPYVFHHNGVQISLTGTAPIRRAWKNACKAAGFAGHVPHCLRRSGVRNMVRSGVDPILAMSISGHRTMSMLQRYAIVSMEDQKRALEQTMAGIAGAQEESKVRAIR